LPSLTAAFSTLPSSNPTPLNKHHHQGDPASRLPARISNPPAQTCTDAQPPDGLCTAVKCSWTYWPGCSNPTIVNSGYCKSTCGTCPAVVDPPSTTATVLTSLTSVTGSTSCTTRKTATAFTLPLKYATTVTKRVAACLTANKLTLGGSLPYISYVTDVVLVAKSRVKSTPPGFSTIACPYGYARVGKNLNDGAKAVGGVSTGIALCVRKGADPETLDPLLELKTASSADGCVAADGWRPLLFGAGSIKEGQAANLAEGTTGAALYVCAKPLTPPA